jgi:hypothetical protein
MTTFRKDPTAKPKRPQSTISTPSGGTGYPADPNVMAANDTGHLRRDRR